VYEEQIVEAIENGKVIKLSEKVPVLRIEQVERRLAEVRAFGTDGKRIEPKSLAGRLAGRNAGRFRGRRAREEPTAVPPGPRRERSGVHPGGKIVAPACSPE
jgi:hypothetical protein